ncbi:MAG: P-II family nitrogen regulator [Thermodesulfovibrionales bacterium]
MKMVTAVVRSVGLERIVKALEDEGIMGLTFFEVKGTGEQVNVFRQYSIHKKIEVIVPDERAEGVARIIFEQGHTGFAGDGLIAILPVECVIKIKKKAMMCDLDFKGMKEVNL